MSALVRYAPDGEGELLAFVGAIVTASAPRAFAPGTPTRLVVTVGESQVPLDVRTIGSKRQKDGCYHVRFRLVSLTKSGRRLLTSAMA